MTDNPNKTKQDRKLVSRQPYEVAYFAKKHGLKMAESRWVIKHFGPSRAKCDARVKDNWALGLEFDETDDEWLNSLR